MFRPDIRICAKCSKEQNARIVPILEELRGMKTEQRFALEKSGEMMVTCFSRVDDSVSEGKTPGEEIADLEIDALRNKNVSIEEIGERAIAIAEEYASRHDDFTLDENCRYYLEQMVGGTAEEDSN